MKKQSIFFKVFAYTMISAALLVCVTAALFSQQFVLLYKTMQTREIVASYQHLVRRLEGKDIFDIPQYARLFHENNQSFEFSIIDNNGAALYATPNADTSSDFDGDFYFVVHKDTDYSIVAQSRTGLELFYRDLIIWGIMVFVGMLALCFACAYVFARQMTNPIKRLAESAGKMAKLEDVQQEPARRDELGDLSRDVHAMYDKLKETISRLADEVQRERELEETQRYFFSAASHELKTPMAATSALLEGMLANIGDYQNHPKYLLECVKMMDAQSKTLSEILEIVHLMDGKILPVPASLNISHFVAEMLTDFQTLASANNLLIQTDIPDGQICFADPKLLQKALSNILSNAVQNTPAGGEVRLSSECMDSDFRLCILNTDASIDETVLPKLFDPFYRVNQARSRKDGCSGLGLTIVQKTLNAMGVEYALENTPDGVLFWMSLPKA